MHIHTEQDEGSVTEQGEGGLGEQESIDVCASLILKNACGSFEICNGKSKRQSVF